MMSVSFAANETTRHGALRSVRTFGHQKKSPEMRGSLSNYLRAVEAHRLGAGVGAAGAGEVEPEPVVASGAGRGLLALVASLLVLFAVFELVIGSRNTKPKMTATAQMIGFPKLWAKIRKLGELPSDITAHTLRHSFASLAADLGYSEPTIAALVGHKGRSITSRYIHSADAVLLAAADAVANRTAELMGDVRPDAQVIPLRA